MKIIILSGTIYRDYQRMDEISRAISEVSGEPKNDIMFTTDYFKLLKWSKEQVPTLIISSHIYDSVGGGGTIAREAKIVNPACICIYYGPFPASNNHVDLVMNFYKKETADLDLSVLVPLVTGDLTGATPAKLKEMFPSLRLM